MPKSKKETRTKNLLSGANFKNPKVRVTIMINEDIIKIFRDRAKESGEGYQTLINRALQEAVMKPTLEDRVAKLEKLLSKQAG